MSLGDLMDSTRCRFALAMLGAMLPVLAATGTASGQDAAKTGTFVGDQAAAGSEWREFHYPELGFVVSFPGVSEKPQADSTPVPGQNPLLHHEFKVEAGKDTVYFLVVFEYPEGRAPNPPDTDYFERVVSGYAKGSDAKIRRKTPLSIDRRPGFEAKAEDDRGKLNHLVTMVANGDRVYMLISAGPKGHATSENALQFRDSFRLLGGPPPPKPLRKER